MSTSRNDIAARVMGYTGRNPCIRELKLAFVKGSGERVGGPYRSDAETAHAILLDRSQSLTRAGVELLGFEETRGSLEQMDNDAQIDMFGFVSGRVFYLIFVSAPTSEILCGIRGMENPGAFANYMKAMGRRT